MKWLKVVWKIWKNREKIRKLVCELKQDAEAVRFAMQDKKVSKKEGLEVVAELKETLTALEEVLEVL